MTRALSPAVERLAHVVEEAQAVNMADFVDLACALAMTIQMVVDYCLELSDPAACLQRRMYFVEGMMDELGRLRPSQWQGGGVRVCQQPAV